MAIERVLDHLMKLFPKYKFGLAPDGNRWKILINGVDSGVKYDYDVIKQIQEIHKDIDAELDVDMFIAQVLVSDLSKRN